MQKIKIIQALNLSGSESLFNKFIDDFALFKRSAFLITQVIVPSSAIALWLKEQISQHFGICANIDFVVLPGPVIQNIYFDNFPDAEIFNFDAATFILYDIISTQTEDTEFFNLSAIKDYITHQNGDIDTYKAYQLAGQLKDIFFEYMFMRTNELVSGAIWKNEPKIQWQQYYWQKLIEHIHEVEKKVVFTDIYQYFMSVKPVKLPAQIILFALPSIFPAQLEILMKLSNDVPLNWYHLAISNSYYGDLLDYSSRNRLERKVLGYPNLTLEDLYLMDGNPLVANLANQSRELTELLLNNIENLDAETLTIENSSMHSPKSALQILQADIRSLNHRITSELRLLDNQDYYIDPVKIVDNDTSIELNICHTRMREVQVAFNSIAREIQQHGFALNEVLISAPDIDDYAAYIQAVFNEEYLLDIEGNKVNIPYNLTGTRNIRFAAIIETIQQLFNVPYKLPISYVTDIISDANIMSNLELDEDNVELIKRWFVDNNTHLGYDTDDYRELKIAESDLYSLKRLINNLTIGSCIPHSVYGAEQLPEHLGNYPVIPYDNLDFAEIRILAKLGDLLDLIILLRNEFYENETTYKNFSLERFKYIMGEVKKLIFKLPEDQITIDRFISSILGQPQHQINLPIVNSLIEDFLQANKGKVRFTGAITCASLSNVRNVPYKLVYVLGLNFGEYPRTYSPNQMSYLASNWYIGDRNYTLEDKQIFLDTILSTQEKLILSYIGRDDTDNSIKEPSSALSLLLETLKNSFVDGENYIKRITKLHSLHPFYNNKDELYSGLWSKVIGLTHDDFEDKRWNHLNSMDLASIAPEKTQKLLNPSMKQLVNTLSYSNTNINKVLDIYSFDNQVELVDHEPFEISSSEIAKQLLAAFQSLGSSKLEELYENGELFKHVQLLGIVGSSKLGQQQLNRYYSLYKTYSQFLGDNKYTVSLKLKHIELSDTLYLKDNVLYITTPFHKVNFNEKATPTGLNLKAQYLIWYLVFKHHQTLYTNEKNELITITPEIKLLTFTMRTDDSNAYGFDPKFVEILINDEDKLLSLIEDFYINSLTSRTLMDNKSIKAAVEELLTGQDPHNILFTVYNELNNSFSGNLDKFKKDPLWANDLDNLDDDKACLLPVINAAKIFAKVIVNE